MTTINIDDNITIPQEAKQKEFKTTLTTTPEGYLDCTQFLADLNAHLDALTTECPSGHLDRKHPLKRLKNHLYGNYFTSSNMSAYMDCPAGLIWNSILPKKPYLSTGSVYHAIMEELVKKINGDWSKFKNITAEEINQIKSQIYNQFNANGEKYCLEDVETAVEKSLETSSTSIPNAIGYLNDATILPSSTTETFIKLDIQEVMNQVQFLAGKQNPTIFHTMIDVIDRIDFSSGSCGNVIIDYKTGRTLNQKSLGIDGYLPQMTVYKWMASAEFDLPFSSVLLFTPQLSKGPKFHLIDTSISNQIAVWEKICAYSDSLATSRENGLFTYQGANKYTGTKTNPAFPFPTAKSETYQIHMKYTWIHGADTPVTNISTIITHNGKERIYD